MITRRQPARWTAAAVLTVVGTGAFAGTATGTGAFAGTGAGAGAEAGAFPVRAHPGDEVVQQVYLTPTASHLAVELDLTPGVLVAPAFARTVDADGDETITAGEAAAHAAPVTSALDLRVDGRAVPLILTGRVYPAYRLLAAAGGAVTVELIATLPPGARSVVLTDRYRPGRTTVQMNALVAKTDPAPLDGITRADQGRTITLTLARPGDGTRTTGGMETPGEPGPVGGTERLAQAAGGVAVFEALGAPLRSPWALAVLIGTCVLLGALHALTPGHGKAMLAAYLVGARSTPGQAVVLGAVITATHTSAVILLGGAVLVAGRFVVPAVLVPVLEVTAGIVVLLLGARLLARRRHRGHSGHGHSGHEHGGHEHRGPEHRGPGRRRHHPGRGRHRYRGSGHGRPNHHDRPDRHGHETGDTYDTRDTRGGRTSPARLLRPAARRRHAPPVTRPTGSSAGPPAGPAAAPAGLRGLAAMGVAGGIIPCPEALSVLLLAIGLNRTALGLTMVVAFSAGLAAVLIGLGLILVSGRTALRRFRRPGTGPLVVWLPVVSAAVVTVLGLAMALSGASALMG
ncbi:hypothetical protein [Planobispora takensis]|uniref:ABC-type nickel/cobalt efflux system, permease component RcnA n=1 Tax=Planobispora takensis TaxID=1367882 RepID=A0A8J3ST68_9ACTN|nr:hypothetical protein [Planobispora takensis]GII00077.1 hypothetical protein Pta02_20850 [Planobispora takensis]